MNLVPTWMHFGLLGLLLAVGTITTSPALAQQTASQPSQATYSTPDEAAAALVDAAKQNNVGRLRDILGPGSEKLINSGDPIADSEGRTRFAAAYAEQHTLISDGSGRMTLEVGPHAWPLPIPLVKVGNRWRFDSSAGAQELVDRRIGRNELAAISSCLAYVDAQKTYFEMTGKRGHATYAQRLISRKGRHDGLYWPTSNDQQPSPMTDFVIKAMDEGYPIDIVSNAPTPLHGYRYRILTKQGPDAPGGAKSYLAHGRMTGGFALVAWPASFGASGIMTFIVNQDGIVFQKDLGPRTGEIAASMQQYNPDLTWARVDLLK